MIQLTNLRVSVLLGVQLDDEALFDGQINVFSGRGGDNLANHVVLVKLQPPRDNVEDLEVLLEALNAETGAAPEQILQGVRKAVDGFVADAEQFDDLTMLCVEYKGR